jgi:hypothetical protein
MNKYIIGTVAVMAATWVYGGQSAQAAPYWKLPELVKTPSDAVFAPPGFDNNDNAQIVIHGDLINTCYKAAPPLVTVDRATKQITVSTQAYVYQSDWCIPVLTPFTQTVDLGILPTAQYRVVEFNKQGGLLHESMLPIAESKVSGPDDSLYAPIAHAQLDPKAAGRVLVLNGVFSTDCMEMQEVKVMHRVANIIEVLPIASYKAVANCQSVPRPFEVRVDLPQGAPGETLIHVRSLNGQSINEVELF